MSHSSLQRLQRWLQPSRRGLDSWCLSHHWAPVSLATHWAICSQTREYRPKLRHRGTVYVSREVSRRNLERASRRGKDGVLLLPPYITATELRLLFHMDYASCLRLLGVKTAESKFLWKDHDGRQFETASKRKILVPFEIARIPLEGLGYKPIMVDVEPDWSPGPDGRGPLQWTLGAAVPVVAVLGHINHGKTTLLDALCSTNYAPTEPGGITQGVRAMTGNLLESGHMQLPKESHRERLKQVSTPSRHRIDPERMTFLDTPGHEAFEILRGRTMAAADAAIVVVSVEHGAEIQTEEVLIHAARWQVPIVFALSKIDLPGTLLPLTKAELRRQCQKLLEEGLVDVDWTTEAENAVPISALYHRNLGDLVERVQQLIEELPHVPLRPLKPPTRTPGAAVLHKSVKKRTDALVGVEDAPIGVALVLEVDRGGEIKGETTLTLLLKGGRLVEGHYFVVGTVLGRISHLAVSVGGELKSWARVETATAGVAVQVTGLRNKYLGGDCAPDDLLFTLPKERAWRLVEHRQQIEALTACQTSGPPLEVSWQFDPLGIRTQAAFERHGVFQPEKHAASAFQRRLAQPAIEEIAAFDGPEQGPIRSQFRSNPRSDFMTQPHKELPQREGVDEAAQVQPSVMETGGRRSGRRKTSSRPVMEEEEETKATEPRAQAQDQVRFQVLSPEDEEKQKQDSERGGGGRKSRLQRQAFGAWAGGTATPPTKDFVYYTDRENWTEEASMDTEKLRARWQWRDEHRWAEEQRKERLEKQHKEMAEAIRREVFGEKEKVPEEEEDEDYSEDEDVEDLPLRNRPVMPLILKTKNVTHFDVLMDEIEKLEQEYRVRLVIVHGGLGPVVPKDVLHAQVEKQYGYCPIYSFQVGSNPEAVSQAQMEEIDIRRFDVFTELVEDLRSRVEKVRRKEASKQYAESLKTQPTLSGF